MQTTHGGPATSPTGTSLPGKTALRSYYRAQRKAHVASLGPAREAAERALVPQLLLLPTLPGPIASYASIGDEIDPQWVEAALGPHAFPRINGKQLSFHLAAWKDLVPGPLGIPQPRADAPEITPRLLLVPLLAATRTGLRLGQGGGYYDRTLAHLRSTVNVAGPVTAIGFAWDMQIADHLPAEPHDQLLDWIATPTQLVDCRQTR